MAPRGQADLLIGADGFRSTVRRLCAPEITPRYAGYVAWRGIAEERDLSPQWRDLTIGQYAFAFPQGGQFIGYPLAGAAEQQQPGRRRYTYLWYHPVTEGTALDDLLTDAAGRTHAYSIPPTAIRPIHVERLRAEAERLLPARLAEVVRHSHGHLVQPIYDVLSERIVHGRVALLGDAAFVARPHVGIGVLKAGQDALALAESLAECPSVDAALARYEGLRLPAGTAAVRYGQYLGAFIERGLAGPESDPALGLDIPTILRTSGRPVPDPLPAIAQPRAA
jgi:2-polyprenyl-6-methoxyphenol hydroxylase-like FAD-dependent oxidoreductase